jgi:diguanylate cyclase (GGDEF)-like protein
MRRSIPLVAGAWGVLAYAAILFWLAPDSDWRTVLANLGQVAVGGAASLACLRAARRQHPGRARRSWLLLGLGLLTYAAGDAYWTWAECVVGEAPAVPSPADLGYLGMVPLAVAGIATRPIVRPRDLNRRLLLLDAGIALSGMTALCWTLVLGPMFATLDTDPIVQAVTLAYPLGDLALVFCLVVLLLREARSDPPTMALALGAGLMAVADLAYLWLVANNAYATGHPVDLAWFAALSLVAVAAAWEPRLPSVPSRASLDVGPPWRFVAPSALVGLGGAVVWAWPYLRDGRPPEPDQAALALAWALLLVRFLLGYRDTAKAHLLEQASRHEAQEQARRDPLTGAANRRAFEAALAERIEAAQGGGAAFGLAFVDFDHFKQFNDTYGHAAGDDALQELVAVLRQHAGDDGLVARVGGDEFALLLPGRDEDALAARVAQLRTGLRSHPWIRASVGGVRWQARMASRRDVLEAADRALYAAKAERPAAPWSDGSADDRRPAAVA